MLGALPGLWDDVEIPRATDLLEIKVTDGARGEGPFPFLH